MGEQRIVVDALKFYYEGVFVAKDIFRMIGNYFYDKGYDKAQERDVQHVTKHGNQVEWQLGPWKKITDYQRLQIRITVIMLNMKKKQVVMNKKKMMADKGVCVIVLNAYTETDYETKWEEKPMFLLLRTLYDKYIFPMHNKRWEAILFDHVNQLYQEIQEYFNMYVHNGLGTIPPSTLTTQNQPK